VIGALAGELEHADGDVFVHEGDLHVEGDFFVADEGVLLLVVQGDLIVEGAYNDSDDPRTIVIVTGSLRARDVVTAGFLEVHGDVQVQGAVLGDYNDCSAWIGGNLSCALFYAEEHFFTVGGALHATQALGDPRHRVRGAKSAPGIALHDPQVLEVLDRELLRVVDHGDELEIDGIADYRAMKQRVLRGLPLRTA